MLRYGVTGNIGDRELGMDMGDRMREVMDREGAGVLGGLGGCNGVGERIMSAAPFSGRSRFCKGKSRKNPGKTAV